MAFEVKLIPVDAKLFITLNILCFVLNFSIFTIDYTSYILFDTEEAKFCIQILRADDNFNISGSWKVYQCFEDLSS